MSKTKTKMKLFILLLVVLVAASIHSLAMYGWLWMEWNPIILAALLGADRSINAIWKK